MPDRPGRHKAPRGGAMNDHFTLGGWDEAIADAYYAKLAGKVRRLVRRPAACSPRGKQQPKKARHCAELAMSEMIVGPQSAQIHHGRQLLRWLPVTGSEHNLEHA